MNNIVKLYIYDLKALNDNSFSSIPYVKDEDIIAAKRFKFAEDQKQHIISSYFKRKYAPDYFFNQYNKPISDMTHINVSHSHNLVICGICDNCDIGVDIEIIKKSEERLRKYVTTDDEYELIRSDEDFFRIWTSKESLVKCYGSGLINNIKEIPGTPLNGKKTYNEETYYSKNIKYNDFIISVTIKSNDNFELEMIEEEIK